MLRLLGRRPDPATALRRAFCSPAQKVEAALAPVLESVAHVPTGTQYDLQAAGATGTQAFEADGNPTDITASLTGTARTGYTKRYADGWSRIFAEPKSSCADSGGTHEP